MISRVKSGFTIWQTKNLKIFLDDDERSEVVICKMKNLQFFILR